MAIFKNNKEKIEFFFLETIYTIIKHRRLKSVENRLTQKIEVRITKVFRE
jgi:hypothetical protein